jgi:alanine racemase
MSHRQSFAEINLAHLKHNTDLMYQIAGTPKFFCPMVKANAYGHGDIQVANFLQLPYVSHLGVGLVEEAIRLRENKIKTPILSFGMFDPGSCESIIVNDITPVISDLPELEYLNSELSQYSNRSLKIHLKFNTGMNRLGADVADADAILKFLRSHPQFHLEGICTHLLNGEDAGASDGDSALQLQKFFDVDEKFRELPHLIHAFNSSAAANIHLRKENKKKLSPDRLSELGSRPGISIYGGQVSTQERGSLDLRPVMSLKSKIALLHKVTKGEVVSYGGRWRADKDTLIGVVPIGYADGYYRNLSNSGEVLCHGENLPVIGTVCMDYFMIDLTKIASRKKIQKGDEVILFGKQGDNQILASDLAQKVGTISYEVLARISGRVPRVYVTN